MKIMFKKFEIYHVKLENQQTMVIDPKFILL